MNDMKTIRRTLVLVFIMTLTFSCIEDDTIEEQKYNEKHEVFVVGEDGATDVDTNKNWKLASSN